jgi:hypothetical protein
VADIHTHPVRVIGEEIKELRMFNLNAFKVALVGIDSMAAGVNGPFDVQSSLFGTARYTTATTVCITKGVCL